MEKFAAPPGSVVRPLTAEESRLLKRALSWRKRRVQKMSARLWQAFLLVIGPLWLGTILIGTFSSHKVSWLTITAVWVGLGAVILLWSLPKLRKESRREREQLRMYQDALNRKQGVVVRIASDQMVEFEEEEDEGACYAFQLPDDRIIFVCGQDFYPTARFPNSDFSLVHIVSDNGDLLDMFITKQGKRLKPLRTISAKTKSRLRIPEHLMTIRGLLRDLEQLIAEPNK